MARRLDRRARAAILVAVALLLAGPLYLAGKLVVAKFQGPEKIAHPEDDQLVILEDGSTMLVRHGSTGRIMADWLQDDPKGTKSFDVGNENFVPNSAALTHEGWEHVAQFSQLLKAHHNVNAEILYSAHHGIADTTELEHKRAETIHAQAVQQGVGEDQIVVAREGFEAGHNALGDEGLEVVLVNKS